MQNNDQEAKADAGKLRLTLVPTEIIRAIAAIREFGIKKYPNGGKDNWKQVEVERYRDAMFRHLLHYLDDPDARDEESGLPALWHLACNAAFLCELEKGRYKGIKEQCVSEISDSIPKYLRIDDGNGGVITTDTLNPEFVKACLKIEPDKKTCETCKYGDKHVWEEPCHSCLNGQYWNGDYGDKWEPKQRKAEHKE